ncbi:hypothetical protein EDD17DRAFT_1567991, partial [Pisolithus thermaeus]
ISSCYVAKGFSGTPATTGRLTILVFYFLAALRVASLLTYWTGWRSLVRLCYSLGINNQHGIQRAGHYVQVG